MLHDAGVNFDTDCVGSLLCAYLILLWQLMWPRLRAIVLRSVR